MSANTDLIKLYSTRILALATDVPHPGRLDAPDGTATERSPICGSQVIVDVAMSDGKIVDFAQDVKACALGQASAAVVGANVIGRSLSEVEAAYAELSAMLKDNGPAPTAPFEDLIVLTPAIDYGNRHASILLALKATIAACKAAA
ncbi:MAG: iron-sulfur cluster assembly scaffold protein [Planktomarina sp.]